MAKEITGRGNRSGVHGDDDPPAGRVAGKMEIEGEAARRRGTISRLLPSLPPFHPSRLLVRGDFAVAKQATIP